MSEKQQTPLESFDGERGMPSVNESDSTAKRGLVVVAFLVVIIVAGGAIFWKLQQKEEAEATQQKGITVASSVPTRTFAVPPPLPENRPTPATPEPEAVAPGPQANPARPAQTVQPPLPGQQRPELSAAAMYLDKSGSSLMVPTGSSRGNGNAPGSPGSDGGASAALAAMTNSNGGGEGGLGGLLNSTATATREAGHLPDRNFLLAKGSFIDCVLQTRLDSTVPGMTACVVTRNIYSDNGKVLLVERGSTVSGEYQANMKQGQERIFVLWSRIKTPNGIVINLDSPGTDPLGGSGLPGYVETHFWKRFGGAIMLSLVDDVARYATEGRRGNNNNIQFSSTGDAAESMAAEALRNTINIPPTLYKNQGEHVGIYVARDLDFSSVYDVAIQ